MNLYGLDVPFRQEKPRATGITWCIDDGVPLGLFEDTIRSFHRLIDGVKFGWGTALVTDVLQEKAAILREYDLDYAFGGTLFEAFYIQHRYEAFLHLVETLRCPVIEISDGTITLPQSERLRAIRRAKNYARIFTEVGSKNPEESARWNAEDWIEQIQKDRDAGAEKIILEARESGTSGLCQPDGQIRSDLTDGILNAHIPLDALMFEAPQKAHQAYWIHLLGPSVNLSNIPMTGSVNLETLRLGLRSDTFSLLEPAPSVMAQ